ncbi:MAG TPA: hypothetical protein VIG44_14100 [Thermomicrobiales bacterium]
MAQRSKKKETSNDHQAIATVEPDTNRRSGAFDRARLSHDKGVIVHRRAANTPDPFIPTLAVKPGVSVIDLLRGEDEAIAERGAGT